MAYLGWDTYIWKYIPIFLNINCRNELIGNVKFLC